MCPRMMADEISWGAASALVPSWRRAASARFFAGVGVPAGVDAAGDGLGLAGAGVCPGVAGDAGCGGDAAAGLGLAFGEGAEAAFAAPAVGGGSHSSQKGSSMGRMVPTLASCSGRFSSEEEAV